MQLSTFLEHTVKMSLTTKEALLDETVWSNPYFIMQYGPLHDNTILMYFADSPWCEPTSNNKTIMNQALYNQALASIVATREAFEKRLKSMSGLEYMVEEAPAETGPGQGTGVWVIRKQMRKKRGPDHEDEVTVLAVYYVIGQNVYPAPSLMDMMSSKLVRSMLVFCFEHQRLVANHPYCTRPRYLMPLATFSNLQTAYKSGRLRAATPM